MDVSQAHPVESVSATSPEAAEGGPIAFVEEGDIIELDLNNRTIELQISEEEFEARRANWKVLNQSQNRLTGSLLQACNECKQRWRSENLVCSCKYRSSKYIKT